MERSWYSISKQATALRKNVLRVDLCVFVDAEKTFSNLDYLNSTVKSLLTAGIINGLDIIGILSRDVNVGLRAFELAKSLKMDISVIPGQTYICLQKEELYVYKLTQQIPQGLTLEKVCEFAHKNNGFVMATNISKSAADNINKLKGSIYAPDAVEVFNAKIGGYRDLNIDYPRFVNSGATSANDLEAKNVFTLIPRKEAAEMKLIGEDEGVDFTPKYLLPKGQ
jgi:hypothetical protein